MDDLPAVHPLLDIDSDAAGPTHTSPPGPPNDTLSARARWLQWTVLSYEQLSLLHQPPYGERAIILKETGSLAGLCGFVPSLAPFDQLPPPLGHSRQDALARPELGLYYAISPPYRREGYATEAARSLTHYAFDVLRVGRIIATTTYDNIASQNVMRRLDMQILGNPYPEPQWLQIVGILQNPSATGLDTPSD